MNEETAQSPRDKAQVAVAPYPSFKSVLNFLDKIQEEHGDGSVPQRVDRSYWGKWFSGGYGPQIVYALRFFGLVDAENRPTAEFSSLVYESPEERSKHFRTIFEDHYTAALDLGLTTATMAQLQKVFSEEYGVTGDTQRKAITFFLHGAEFAGINVGSHLRRSPAKRRAATVKRRTTKTPPPETPGGQKDTDFVDLKRKYLEALIKKVEDGDADPDLLNRVQALLFEQRQAERATAILKPTEAADQ